MGTTLFSQAVVAAGRGAALALVQTVLTEPVVAVRAALTAVAAMTVAAAQAELAAAFAEPRAAATAFGGVFIVRLCTAVAAGERRPLGERDIGGAGVVGPQDLPHQQAKFPQPPLLQRAGEHRLAVPFAELFLLDVRMRDSRLRGGGTGVERPDLIGRRTAELIQVEPDLERTQVDVFEHDPFGGDRQRPFPPVQFNVFKLLVERLQFFPQLPQVERGRRGIGAQQAGCQGREFAAEQADFRPQTRLALGRGGGITPHERPAPLAFQSLQLLAAARERLAGKTGRRRRTLVLLFQKQRRPQEQPARFGDRHQEASFRIRDDKATKSWSEPKRWSGSAVTTGPSFATGRRHRANIAVVHQESEQHQGDAQEHRPGSAGGTCEHRSDHCAQKIKTVEPLPGSHKGSFTRESGGR